MTMIASASSRPSAEPGAPCPRRPLANSSVGDDAAPDDAFARLVRLIDSNDHLLAELRGNAARLERASAYADAPRANRVLAAVYLQGMHVRRSRILALLRANRLAAEEFLKD